MKVRHCASVLSDIRDKNALDELYCAFSCHGSIVKLIVYGQQMTTVGDYLSANATWLRLIVLKVFF